MAFSFLTATTPHIYAVLRECSPHRPTPQKLITLLPKAEYAAKKNNKTIDKTIQNQQSPNYPNVVITYQK